MGEISLKQWIDNWEEGLYNKRDRDTMCEAGWYDWFCHSNSLYSRLKKLAPKVIWFAGLGIINPEKVYVFFKNNCPVVGELYDDFRICDLNNDSNVIFTIVPKSGHRNIKEPAELWGINPDTGEFEGLLKAKNWNELKKKITENIDFLKRSVNCFYDREEQARLRKEKEKRDLDNYLLSKELNELGDIFNKIINKYFRNHEQLKYMAANFSGIIKDIYKKFNDYVKNNISEFVECSNETEISSINQIELDKDLLTNKAKEMLINEFKYLNKEESIKTIKAVMEYYFINLNSLKIAA